MHFPLEVPGLTGSKPGVGPEGNSCAHSHARKLAGFSKKKKKKRVLVGPDKESHDHDHGQERPVCG